MKVALILLVLAAACGACPELKPQLPFDWDKFGGLWFVHQVMRNNPETEPVLKCLDIYFKRVDDMNLFANSTAVLDTGFEHDFEGQGHIMDLERPSHWKATWIGIEYDNHVLETDYTTYSLNYACTELDDGTVAHHGVIMGRAGVTLDDALMDRLIKMLSDNGVDVSTFYKLSPVHCEERF